LAEEWDEHSRQALEDVERHVFNPVNYFLMAKHFAVDWQQTIDHYFSTQTNQRTYHTVRSPTVRYDTIRYDTVD